MDKLDYSVLIRTTGKAKEKYKKLLLSVQKLEPQPKEIIVVLPEGNNEPEFQIGIERFVFTQKGMVSQRLKGIDECRSKYALVCDDDISFDRDYVKKLAEPLLHDQSKISIGPLYSFLPETFMSIFISAISGTAIPTVFNKGLYNFILLGTGYSYNRNLTVGKYYYTQSAPWTSFFAECEALRSIHLEDEYWLDTHGYASLDDQTMFYKAWLKGIKTIVVPDAIYEHLDAKSSTAGNQERVIYSLIFNRTVFWHRFIYSQKNSLVKKIGANVCFGYVVLWKFIFNLKQYIQHEINKQEYVSFYYGLRDAVKFVHSKEYFTIPGIHAMTIKH